MLSLKHFFNVFWVGVIIRRGHLKIGMCASKYGGVYVGGGVFVTVLYFDITVFENFFFKNLTFASVSIDVFLCFFVDTD